MIARMPATYGATASVSPAGQHVGEVQHHEAGQDRVPARADLTLRQESLEVLAEASHAVTLAGGVAHGTHFLDSARARETVAPRVTVRISDGTPRDRHSSRKSCSRERNTV